MTQDERRLARGESGRAVQPVGRGEVPADRASPSDRSGRFASRW
jgi:hypothetical protein